MPTENWNDMKEALPSEADAFGGGVVEDFDAFGAGTATEGEGFEASGYVPPPIPVHNYEKEEIREHGWAEPTGYDYTRYQQQGARAGGDKAGAGAGAGAGAIGEGDIQVGESASGPPEAPSWESGAVRYEWSDEYGEIGPAVPELEKILFGDEDHVRAGPKFDDLNQIKVVQEGTIRIQPIVSFDDAGLHPAMRENVKLAGYEKPTSIQSYSLPAIHQGYDIVACAQTGSGKTAAFLIPTLSKLMGKAKKLAAPRPNPATYQEGVDQRVVAEPLLLIVCPNRELAVQIFTEARRFCYRSMLRPCVIYGGGPVGEQARQLQKGCDVLIGTPGRLVDFIDKPHILSLRRLKYMVIDEADELLNDDWSEELGKIMSGGDQEEGNITYMMFSATFPKIARDLAKTHLAHDYVRIRVGRAGSTHANIQQQIVYTLPHSKRQALMDLLMSKPPARTIIFVNSKKGADELDDYLYNMGLPCTSIHSDRTQLEREDALRAFRKGEKPILVATGVSARGIDVHNVMHVINFDLPSTMHGGLEDYCHRIGRTARIGNLGLATSFYNERNDDIAEELTHFLQETNQEIPEFLEQYKAENLADLHFEADSDEEGAEGADSEGDGGFGASGGDDGFGAADGGDGFGASPGGDGFGASEEAGGLKAPAKGAKAEDSFAAPAAPTFTAPTFPASAFAAPAFAAPPPFEAPSGGGGGW